MSRLGQAVISLAGRRAAGPGFACRSLDVIITPATPGSYLITATYALRSLVAAGASRLVLSALKCPLHVERIDVAGFRPMRQAATSAYSGPLLHFAAQSGPQCDAKATVTYRWMPGQMPDGNAGPETLVMPDAMFWPVQSLPQPTNQPRCRITVDSAACHRSGAVLGVTAEADGSRNEYIQVMYCPGLDAPRRAAPVLLAPQLAALLDPWGSSRLSDMANRYIEHLGDFHGLQLPGHILLGSLADAQGMNQLDAGAIVFVAPDQSGHVSMTNTNLMMQLSRAWWGTGCNVLGRGGTELGDGFGFAAMVDWFERSDPAFAAKFLQRMEALAGDNGRTMSARLRGGPDTRQVVRWGLAVRAARLDHDRWNGIQSLLRSHWSRYLDAAVLTAALGVSPR